MHFFLILTTWQVHAKNQTSLSLIVFSQHSFKVIYCTESKNILTKLFLIQICFCRNLNFCKGFQVKNGLFDIFRDIPKWVPVSVRYALWNPFKNDPLHELMSRTRICASLGSRMKFKTLCYPVFGRNKKTFWFPIILIAFNASIVCPINK